MAFIQLQCNYFIFSQTTSPKFQSHKTVNVFIHCTQAVLDMARKGVTKLDQIDQWNIYIYEGVISQISEGETNI